MNRRPKYEKINNEMFRNRNLDFGSGNGFKKKSFLKDYKKNHFQKVQITNQERKWISSKLNNFVPQWGW